MRKKILFWIWVIWTLIFTWNRAFAQYDPNTINWFWNTTAAIGYWVAHAWDAWDDELLDIIKRIINWILWLLSLLALILCLRWWFQMLTAWWDDAKVKKWVKVLKNAAIWLAVIWISWLIVSLVFRIIQQFAWTPWTP